jgi:hypothetical protein
VNLGRRRFRVAGGRDEPVDAPAGQDLLGERAAEGEPSGERADPVRP